MNLTKLAGDCTAGTPKPKFFSQRLLLTGREMGEMILVRTRFGQTARIYFLKEHLRIQVRFPHGSQ